ALLERDQRQLVIEMDGRDERDPYLPFDLAELLGGFLDRHRAADDVASGRLEGPDLEQGCLDVTRVGLGHGLHGDRGAAADREAAQLDLPRFPPCDHWAVLSKNSERVDSDEGIDRKSTRLN